MVNPPKYCVDILAMANRLAQRKKLRLWPIKKNNIANRQEIGRCVFCWLIGILSAMTSRNMLFFEVMIVFSTSVLDSFLSQMIHDWSQIPRLFKFEVLRESEGF